MEEDQWSRKRVFKQSRVPRGGRSSDHAPYDGPNIPPSKLIPYSLQAQGVGDVGRSVGESGIFVPLQSSVPVVSSPASARVTWNGRVGAEQGCQERLGRRLEAVGKQFGAITVGCNREELRDPFPTDVLAQGGAPPPPL